MCVKCNHLSFNRVLQMRAACSQLAAFEAEVGRLTESQALSQEEWTNKSSRLECELTEATAQKVERTTRS